jgi:sugar lactone lactonase YvrE
VADTGNGRLLRYSIKEGAIEVGTVEIKVDQLSYPIKTAINSRGEIYTLDRRQRSIARFSPAGEFRGYLKPVGLPSPTAYVPRSFTVDRSDNIYVLDILSERVLILDPAGRYVRQIKFPDEYGFFSDVAMGFRGTVLLIDVVDGKVFSAGKNSASFSRLTSSLKEYVRFPASLTTDDRGRIYLADRNGGSIIILGQDGSFISRQSGMGWKEGSLNYPAQMCINNKGEIFIADTRNHRIQIFAIVE